MRVKDFKWLFVAAVAAFLIASNVAEFNALGISSESSSDGIYRYSGGTSPWALVIAAAVIGLYLWLLNAEPSGLGEPLPTVFRRLLAFCFDFVLATAAFMPILGIAPAVVEWRRTGIFQWSFERTTPASGDLIMASGVLLLAAFGLIFYFALPLVLRRPSPGTCILGYQIVPDDGVTMTVRSAIFRTLLGFAAVCGAYVAPFVGRDRKNGKFWLDKVFRTRALRLT